MWVDEAGEVWASQMPLGPGMMVEQRRVPREVALQEGEPAEILLNSVLRPDRAIERPRDVAELVHGEGTTCRIIRPDVAGQDDFYGPHEPSEQVIHEALPVEFHFGSPQDLEQEGVDATADVEFEPDVVEGDFLEFEGVRYRVTDVEPRTVFGAKSHKRLILERNYEEES